MDHTLPTLVTFREMKLWLLIIAAHQGRCDFRFFKNSIIFSFKVLGGRERLKKCLEEKKGTGRWKDGKKMSHVCCN